MNCIILPPTTQEIAEYERRQKELEDRLDKEMLAPIGEAFKKAFNTIEILGMRLSIVEGTDCPNCVFCTNKDRNLCGIHFNGKTPCIKSDGSSGRHFKLIEEDNV